MRTYDRQAAVIIHEVEAELGVVQLLGEIAQRSAPLAGIVRVAVRAAPGVQEVGVVSRNGREGWLEGSADEGGEGVVPGRQAHVAEVEAGERDDRPFRARTHMVER